MTISSSSGTGLTKYREASRRHPKADVIGGPMTSELIDIGHAEVPRIGHSGIADEGAEL